MTPAERTDGAERRAGRLLVVGGHEQRDAEGEILKHWVEMTGGAGARLIVCGVPLDDPAETLAEYEHVFRALGAAEVRTEPFTDRQAGENADLLEELDRATGVYFTGGDQLRAVSQMAGTEFGERLQRRMQSDGLMIGGTSAGAAMMSGTMLIGGPSDGTVRRGDIEVAPGLGLWRDAVVDTHFSQRGRVSRILTLFASNPQVLGVGIDEDTAVEVEPGVAFRVHGRGAVLAFDGRVTHTNAADVDDDGILALMDSKIHVLPRGYGFDLTTKRPLEPHEVEARR